MFSNWLLYLSFIALIILWSSGWISAVKFGGRWILAILLKVGVAWLIALSIKRMIFLFFFNLARIQFWQPLCKNIPGHPRFWIVLYNTGRLPILILFSLNTLEYLDFLIIIGVSFSPVTLNRIGPLFFSLRF